MLRSFEEEEPTRVRRDSESSVSSITSAASLNGHRHASRIIDHVNVILANLDNIRHLLPLTLTGSDNRIFSNAARDGILLSELLNHFVPNLVNKEKLHTDFSNPSKKVFLMLENQILVLEAAKKLGCRFVNVSPSDLAEGRGYLVLSLIWQICKNGMLKRVQNFLPEASLANVKAMEDGDNLCKENDEADLAIISMIGSIVRPISPNVRRASVLLEDNELMSCFFQQAGAKIADIAELTQIQEPAERAEKIVQLAKKLLGAHCMIEAKDILNGNSEMIVMFLASLLERVLDLKNKAGGAIDDKIKQVESDVNERIEELLRIIEQYKEEAKRLSEENDCLGDRIISLHAELESLKMAQALQKACDEEEATAEDTANSSTAALIDDILRAQIPPADNPALDHAALRLRSIYQNSSALEPLCQAIYGSLSLQSLQMGSTKSGVLRKKDRDSMKWRTRFMILRDNFVFVYKESAAPKDKPVEIFRVDDALVRVMFEVEHMADPVISVEIASKINPSYVYLSALAADLCSWKDSIIAASTWWVNSV